MLKSATEIAAELLQGEAGGLEEIRVHSFVDDESAHDDELIAKLYVEFAAEFNVVCAELTEKFGNPIRVVDRSDRPVPLCGAFRSAVWSVGKTDLFVAAAHEDRECPILLVLGTAPN